VFGSSSHVVGLSSASPPFDGEGRAINSPDAVMAQPVLAMI
jgi:hypothetical protein